MGKKKLTPAYYAVIPANVRYDKKLTMFEIVLFAEISTLINLNGVCYAQNKYFADLYEKSMTTISRAIGNLRDCGYLVVELQYKKGTKEIKRRLIHLSPEMCIGVPEKIIRGIPKNVNRGMPKNVKGNNSIIINNNTYDNKKDNDVHAYVCKADFDWYWNLYPKDKRSQKGTTVNSWNKVCDLPKKSKTGVSRPTKKQIKKGVKAILKSELYKKDPQYIPGSSPWLNKNGWLNTADDYKVRKNGTTKPNEHEGGYEWGNKIKKEK